MCRRLIKEYRRVTTAPEMLGGFDIRGTIDLGLHYIEVGTNYVNEIGWDEERPYNSMGAVAAETAKLCQDKSGQKWAGVFLPRVRAVAEAAHNVGYGFGDDLADMVAVFEETAAVFEEKRAKRSWSCLSRRDGAPIPPPGNSASEPRRAGFGAGRLGWIRQGHQTSGGRGLASLNRLGPLVGAGGECQSVRI
jgi:hypothetical protein